MLHTLAPAPGSTQRRKRVARGNSAGGGTTAGRGTKGQHSRAGKGRRLGFEGGQVPLIRRQPKLHGFTYPFRVEHEVLTLASLEKRLEPGTYDLAALKAAKLIHSNRPVKLLGNNVKKKFELTVHAASAAAKEQVKKAGGSVHIVPFRS